MPECSGAPNESKPARLSSRIDHRLVREGAADAAIFLRDGGAKQPGRAGLGPHLALIHALLAPALDMRREFRADEAPRLLFEQRQVLGHPGRSGKIERVHGGSRSARQHTGWRPAARGQRPLTFALPVSGWPTPGKASDCSWRDRSRRRRFVIRRHGENIGEASAKPAGFSSRNLPGRCASGATARHGRDLVSLETVLQGPSSSATCSRRMTSPRNTRPCCSAPSSST